jgi:hypothetical protein
MKKRYDFPPVGSLWVAVDSATSWAFGSVEPTGNTVHVGDTVLVCSGPDEDGYVTVVTDGTTRAMSRLYFKNGWMEKLS